MPIRIAPKRKIEVDEEGNIITEEKPFHIRMFKYDECPYCGYDKLGYVVDEGESLDIYYCPNCGRSFT